MPPEGIPTLTLWWGLCGHIIPRVLLTVAYATDRASHAREVKGDDPDKKGYPGPPGWGVGVGLTTQHSKKRIVTKVEQRQKLDRLKDDGESW
jgi:U3 small nucleolar RNA-associated protein 14